MAEGTPELVPDLKAQYSEGGSALRHYSLCVLNLRVVTVAQGLILLTGSAVLFREGLFVAAGLTAVFGIIVALVLWAVQRSYWICFDSVLAAVVAIEKKGKVGEIFGPWGSYDMARKNAYGAFWWNLLVKHVPYLLLWIAFSAILAASIMAESRSGSVAEISNTVLNLGKA